MHKPDFYLVEELAEKLRVNKMTIYRRIKAGKIEVYKIGKEYRITREAFEKFLETYAKATS
jgi:excisionase family DNA binding protein